MKIRSALRRAFFTLSFVTTLGILLIAAYTSAPAPVSLGDADRLAYNALRVINTVEKWAFDNDGSYLALDRLAKSPQLEILAQDELAEKKGVGQSTLTAMSFDGVELVPRYTVTFNLDQHARGYLLSLRRIGDENNFAFVTDQTGGIYFGR